MNVSNLGLSKPSEIPHQELKQQKKKIDKLSYNNIKSLYTQYKKYSYNFCILRRRNKLHIKMKKGSEKTFLQEGIQMAT